MTVRPEAAARPDAESSSVEADFVRFRDGGDPRALARVFDALAPDLLLAAAHLGRDASEAEDLLQSTFVTAIERRKSYDAQRPLRAWLVGILAIQHRRQRRMDARTPDPERTHRQVVADPQNAAEAAEFANAMERALARMPQHYRQPLNLRLLHGLSTAEIAHVSGCAPATVKTRLQRGLAHLRRALPASLASSFAAAALPERGLAAVREIVLAGAEQAVAPAVVATPSVIAGVLVVKQLTLAALAVVLIAAGWWAASPPPSVATPPAGKASSSPGGASVAPHESLPTPTPEPSTREAVPMASEPAGAATSTTTALRVRFVWSDDDTPVVNHRVRVERVDDPLATAAVQTTDDTGRIEVANPHPGTYRFAHGGFERKVLAVLGEVVEETVRLDGVILVEGIVRNAQAQPVGGAEIWFGGGAERRSLATTAPDGTFVTRLAGGGHLWAKADRYLPSTVRPIEGTKGSRQRLEIELDVAGHWLSGQVVSANGVAVAGARIAIETDSARGIIRGPDGDQQLARPPLVLTAGPDGRFESRCVPSGARRLIAHAKGHGAVIVELNLPTQRSVVVQLGQPASIRGTIRDANGAPIARGQVALRWKVRFDGLISIYQEFCLRRTHADLQGRYELTDLPAGDHLLHASSRELPRVDHDMTLAEGEAAVWDPTMQSGSALSGRLVDVDGKPVSGWRIAAQAPKKSFRYSHAQTDADGRFHFDQLPDVEHNLRARPPQQLGDAATIVWGKLMGVRPGGAPVTLQLSHRFGDGGFVKGRLLDADGRGLTGGRVMLDGPAFGRQVLDAHADDGVFRVGPFPAGRYRVTVQDGTGGYLQLGQHEVPPSGDVDLGSMQFKATSRIAVFLDHATGAEVRASIVASALEHGGGSHTFTRRADGAYLSGPLRPGKHMIAIRGEEIAPAKQEVDVIAGRVTEVRVPVAAATLVTLKVDGPANDTGSVDYVLVHVSDAAGNKVYSQLMTLVPNASNGSLRQGFAPGNYSLRAESPKRKLVGTIPFVVSGDGQAMATTVTLQPK